MQTSTTSASGQSRLREPMGALLDLLVADDLSEAAARLDHATWPRVVSDAVRNGVAPLLWARLCNAPHNSLVPATAMQTLERTHVRASIENLRLSAHLARVLRDFQAAGIDAIVLKGAFLASAVYRDRGLRPMCDIDVLVRRDDLQAATATLIDQGWHCADSTASPRGRHALSFTRDGVDVDLHWNIEDETNFFRIDVEGLWQRARKFSVAGQTTSALAPEDLLLHLCLHTSYCHGWLPFSGGLRHLWDIAVTIRHYNADFRWDTFIARANAWGVGNCAWLALSLAQDLVRAPVPGQTLDRLTPAAFDEDFVDLARALTCGAHHVELSKMFPVLAHLWLDKRWWRESVAGRTIELVLPDRKWLDAAYPSLRSLPLACYFVHYADLGRDLAAMMFTRAGRALHRREMQRHALIRWLESTAHFDAGDKTAVTYRDAMTKDCVAVARVNVQSLRQSLSEPTSRASPRVVSIEQRAAMFRRRFDADFYRMFVAEIPRRGIVGFVDVGKPRENEWRCAAELYAIYVLKDFRGQGIGRRLFQMAIEAARAEGRDSMYLMVLEDSPYRAFYEKLAGCLIAEKPRLNGEQPRAIYAWRNLNATPMAAGCTPS